MGTVRSRLIRHPLAVALLAGLLTLLSAATTLAGNGHVPWPR
jgi:hypothetical protein